VEDVSQKAEKQRKSRIIHEIKNYYGREKPEQNTAYCRKANGNRNPRLNAYRKAKREEQNRYEFYARNSGKRKLDAYQKRGV
jgi:hypothetical protein